MVILTAALWLGGIYLSCYVAYWLLLLGTHFVTRPGLPGRSGGDTRFAILIPAHNEELLLERLLVSVREQVYPVDRFNAVVVADNCNDKTAQIARAAGAITLERTNTELRGKGYALKWGLESIDLSRYDAVLVVDADCIMSSNTLSALDASIRNRSAIQCYSGIGNPDESWFTRLLDVSRTISNQIYSPARQCLGLAIQLLGTGMCFKTSILSRYGWDAFTVGEDCEYFVKLVQNGETIGYDGAARILHQESATLKQATTQRMRWSSGRFAIASRYGLPLLARGVAEGNIVKFDAGLSLLLPNPSLGMNASLLCLLVSGASGQYRMAEWFLLLALIQFGIFLTGVYYTRNRAKKLMAIIVAPAFLAWKMGIDVLTMLGVGRKKWVRTERKL